MADDSNDPARRFFADARDEAIESQGENFRLIMDMRPEERKALLFLLREFGTDDLQVMRDSLENLRTLRRFGRFGAWLFGFVIAGASVAALVKTFFTPGASK